MIPHFGDFGHWDLADELSSQHRCERRKLRLVDIDLRSGASQEAALDGQTMNVCFVELACWLETVPSHLERLRGCEQHG